uniref:Uncharacterized protein n=1 Tax=viral metagenome TaxID=1070528 RepID=A0A6M3LFF7_9ZZZZ
MKIRYKLARIVNGKYLSANQREREPYPPYCLEYEVGEVVEAPNKGIACYKRRKNALTPLHIAETSDYFNNGEPIALLKLEAIGRSVWTSFSYRKGETYEGGINYGKVKVLEATTIK